MTVARAAWAAADMRFGLAMQSAGSVEEQVLRALKIISEG